MHGTHSNIFILEFPEEYKQLWDSRTLNDSFKLPERNPYICSNFELFTNEDHTVIELRIFRGINPINRLNFRCIPKR